MPRKALIVLTSVDKYPDGSPTGWYLPEAAHPYARFIEKGVDVEFASIDGTASCDPSSIEASQDDVDSMKFWNDPSLRAQTEKNKKLSDCKHEDYQAVFFAGGFGVMWDFPESEAAIKLISAMLEAKKPVAAVCHGPIVFKNVKDAQGLSVLAGKQCTGFTNAEERAMSKYEVVSEPSGPGSCEDVLGKLGTFKDGGTFQPNVCVADFILTGQNPPSAGPLAEAVVAAIDKSEAVIEALKKAGIAGSLFACLDMSDTMLVPFLGEFFVNHGVSQAYVGFTFAMMSLGMLIFCPLVPYIMPKIGGPARTLAFGTLMFCLVRLATACMDFFPSEGDVTATELAASANVLAPLAALIFFLTGCLYSFSEIGGLAWILSISPDGSKGWTMAAMMSARMSGALLGTPVGGVLFDLIGWGPTNLSCIVILLVPVIIFRTTLLKIIPPAPKVDKPNVYTDKKFIVASLIALIAQCSMYAYVPYLQLWLYRDFGVIKSLFGVIFTVGVVIGFMVGSVVVVKLEETYSTSRAILFGFFMFALGYILVGPSPLLPFLPHTGWGGLTIVILGWYILLLGNGALVTITPPLILKYATEFGLSEQDAPAETAMLNILMTALALFVGPVFGAVSAQHLGAPWTNTLLGINLLVVGPLTILLLNRLSSSSKTVVSTEMV